MVPPQSLGPLSLSSGVCRQAGLNPLAAPAPYSEWPGWASVYKRAVDSGSLSVLNALDVLALALAMAWLPPQTAVGSSVDTATAHNRPERSTTAAHSLWPPSSPPASPALAACWSSFF